MNKKKITFVIVGIIALIAVVLGITYAYFTSTVNTENANIIYNTAFEDAYYFTVSLANNANEGASFSLLSEDMLWSESDTVAASDTNTFTFNLENNSDKAVVCTYDYIWKWTTETGYNNYTISSGATKEFTVSGPFNEKQVPNYNASSFVMGSGEITATSGNTTTENKTVTTKFYNLANVDQASHKGKKYKGYLTVGNAECYSPKQTLADFIINNAPKSGTDNVTNSPWILTSDHTGEYRYAGKNPDNYISFNGELWRIIGVMPNMTYCTGTYKDANECSTTETGGLVKIIRNSTLGDIIWDYKQTGVGSSTSTNGSNDWSDSQLQLMFNGTTYLKTGYDKNGNQLHTSYSIASNVVSGNGYNYYNATYSYLDGNGTTVYVPSRAATSGYTATSGTVPKKIGSDYINKIATVKWDLYGTGTYDTAAEGSPAAFYNKERNINSTGAVYETGLVENRPAYWYGKVGLMYPSDYGYATNGGDTYNRATCLGYQMSGWSSGSYQTDCAGNSWLWYTGIEGTAGSTGTAQWTLSPSSSFARIVFYVNSGGFVGGGYAYVTSIAVRPVLYLRADTIYGGEGEGTYNSPYTIE